MGLRVDRWVGQTEDPRVGRLEGLRVDPTVGQMEDRLEGLRVDPTVVLKGGLREDQSEGQMVVRWVEQMAGLRGGRSEGQMVGRWVDQTEGQRVGPLVDHSVVMKGALVVPKVEVEAGWLPSQQEEREVRSVLLPRAVQQGLVRLVA